MSEMRCERLLVVFGIGGPVCLVFIGAVFPILFEKRLCNALRERVAAHADTPACWYSHLLLFRDAFAA